MKIDKKDNLFTDISQLIEQSKTNIAISVNAELTMLYWQVGKRINENILKSDKPEYGKQIVSSISERLTTEYGKGWGQRHLYSCIKVYTVFPDFEILHALRTKLTWTHLRLIINVEDELKREFYIEMCKLEKWSSRQLQERIQSMLYERTAISKKPDATIKQELELLKNEQKLSSDLIFRDPYFLDFLGLKDTYSEKDLETSIVAELQHKSCRLPYTFAIKRTFATKIAQSGRNCKE